MSITTEDGEQVAHVTVDAGREPVDVALETLRGTSWPSGIYLFGGVTITADSVDYVAGHARDHAERLPWLRCADVQCTVAPALTSDDATMIVRTRAVRAAAARDERCRPDDAQALLELIEHSRDAAAALTLPGSKFLHDPADVASSVAVDLVRAATIAHTGAKILQAMVCDDDPVRWSHELADALERESRVGTGGGDIAQVRNALRPHTLEGVRAILSTMRRSVNAWELLAVTSGVRFGGFELTREIEAADQAADRAETVRTGQAAADALADEKARPQ